MYENYLLHTPCLAQVINELDSEREQQVTDAGVEAWLSENARKSKYFDPGVTVPSYPSLDSERTVHAAKLVKDLFDQLTINRVEYRKKQDGLRLTQLLIQEPTDALQELGAFLNDLLP